jgi:2-succinyl-5-enolpyruvyl-6-hydroxy-3-cyclohexene-1-carboxylate synthase
MGRIGTKTLSLEISFSMKNSVWAHCLIDQLIQQGVTRFCIAPGSRSTPLALAAARHHKANLTVHFDERALGFFALGCAMASGTPAALIVTSGTAVGNLLPAVMEAAHSNIPLILLSADRPPELRDCGANQATDQIKIFQNFVVWQTDLPCPNEELSEGFVRSQAALAVAQSMQCGPVQINCQFREPLFEPASVFSEGSAQPFFLPTQAPSPDLLIYVEEILAQAKRGLIVIGRLSAHSNTEAILNLAKRLGWPVFADLLSQARCQRTPEQILQFDYAIRSEAAPTPDYILHFGDRFTSKELPVWIQKTQATVLHIDSSKKRLDPLHERPIRIQSDPALLCLSLNLETTNATEPGWLEAWQTLDARLQESLDATFEEPHPFTEDDFMRKLSYQLPVNSSVFLANSMPIRNAEHFLFPHLPQGFYANRGLSGIDGQIATAAGIAAPLKTPMPAILGDLSCLHDLNSLALLHSLETPFLLLVSNNFGGGIFSHLPLADDCKQEHFEKLFATSHDFRFEGAANMFSIPYQSACTIEPLEGIFPEKGPLLFEIFTSRKENACFQKRILGECSLSLARAISGGR